MKKQIWPIVLALAIVLLVTGGLSLKRYMDHEYYLSVTLEGERELILEYGQDYEEPGASAIFYGSVWDTEPVEVEVSVRGAVDVTELGEYRLCYIARHESYVGTAYRVVRVTDTQPPVITLVSDPNHYTLQGQPYVEEGYAAVDVRDGDLTDRVCREEKDGTVIYTVSDDAGNTAQLIRKIRYLDTVPPEVTLQGKPHVILFQGAVYQEAGCTAADDCDGDLTDQISCTGTVDTQQIGSHTLTYTAVDSFGNQTSVQRVVTVIPVPTSGAIENVPAHEQFPAPGEIEPNGKSVCLTFDDGPGPYTPQLLDVLKKYNVKATFFVMNTSCFDTVKRIHAEGHTVAIHTASHNYHKIYASEKAYFDDLAIVSNKVQALTGEAPKLLRFPGGSSNTISRFNKGIMSRLTRLVEEKGYRYFDWNVDSQDAGGARTADKVRENVISGVLKRDYSVVLQHDVKDYSIEAVEGIILWAYQNGYRFEALTEESPSCKHGVSN